MKKYRNLTQTTTTIGIDLGDRYSYYMVLNEPGEIIDECRIKTSETALMRLSEKYPAALIGIEVGTYSPWVSRLLRGRGHQVLVANARKLRLIAENLNKDDRADAETLARVARFDPKLMSPIEHRSEEMQQDLSWITARAMLVKNRTALINYVRMAVKAEGQRLPSRISTAAFHKIPLEGVLKHGAIAGLMEQIGALTQQIKHYDRQLEKLCSEKYPETAILRQIKGVGPQISLAYVLKVQQPGRFANSRQVGAYFGLCPRRSQSGNRDPQLRITKAGDRLMRQLLMQAAHYIKGPFGQDSDLRRHGERIAARGGANARKRALVAVARKLAVLMHHLWATGQVYEPLYNANKLENCDAA